MNDPTASPFLTNRARRFAEIAHEGQKRRYTGEPYITHPAAVVEILGNAGASDIILAAAWLHDVVEDCNVTHDEILENFGPIVARLVFELTDQATLEMGNRAIRKAFERDRLAKVSAAAQTIKSVDITHNASSIKEHSPAFWEVFRKEALEVLDVMEKADPELRGKAYAVLA